jgi:hypothetical protein
MYAFRLDAADVRIAQRHVSDSEHRGPIRGMLVEENGTIAATDGHTLFACAPDPAVNCNTPPRAMILRFAKAIPTWATWIDITPSETRTDAPIVATCSNARGKQAELIVHELAGPFPQWRQVVPRALEVTAPLPPINPALLERFSYGQTARVLCVAQRNPEAAILVHMPTARYLGLIMPMRVRDDFAHVGHVADWAVAHAA